MRRILLGYFLYSIVTDFVVAVAHISAYDAYYLQPLLVLWGGHDGQARVQGSPQQEHGTAGGAAGHAAAFLLHWMSLAAVVQTRPGRINLAFTPLFILISGMSFTHVFRL